MSLGSPAAICLAIMLSAPPLFSAHESGRGGSETDVRPMCSKGFPREIQGGGGASTRKPQCDVKNARPDQQSPPP